VVGGNLDMGVQVLLVNANNNLADDNSSGKQKFGESPVTLRATSRAVTPTHPRQHIKETHWIHIPAI